MFWTSPSQREFQVVLAIQQRLESKLADRVLRLVSELGKTPLHVVVILAMLPFDLAHAWRLAALIASSEVVNWAIKRRVMRLRPFAAHAAIENKDRSEGGSSFPSCHAQNAIVFWGYLMQTYDSTALGVLGVAMIALTLLSRLYLGMHYLSDVVAGCAIGWAILGIVAIC